MIEGFLFRANFPYKNQINNVKFSLSSFFSVSKKLIRSYDKIVYLKLLSELINLNPQGGTNAHILKRLWLYIFSIFDKNLINNSNKNNKKYIITEPNYIETKELVVDIVDYNKPINQHIKRINQHIKRNNHINSIISDQTNTNTNTNNIIIDDLKQKQNENYNYIHENILNFNIIKDHINATLNNKNIRNINKFI